VKPKRKINDLYRLTLWDHLQDATIIRLATAQPIESVAQILETKFNKRLPQDEVRQTHLKLLRVDAMTFSIHVRFIENEGKRSEIGLQFDGRLEEIEGGTELSGVVRMSHELASEWLLVALVIAAIIVLPIVLSLTTGLPSVNGVFLLFVLVGIMIWTAITVHKWVQYLAMRRALLVSLAVILPDGRKAL
jgi:hypothetical protein